VRVSFDIEIFYIGKIQSVFLRVWAQAYIHSNRSEQALVFKAQRGQGA
jgi:hypothetical protein